MDTSNIFSFLKHDYGLAEPFEVRCLESGANENFLVASHGRRYVYRIYIEHAFYPRNPRTFQYELELLVYLSDARLPVPRAVSRLDGQLLSVMNTPTGPRYGALFHFFEGEEHIAWHPEVNEQAVVSFGASVAEIHQQTDRFQKPFCRHHFDLQYLLDGPLQTLEAILKKRRGEVLAFFNDYADFMRQQITAIGKGKEVYGLIHADLHVGNILYHPEAGFCILDFDQCAYGWRAYDVATYKYNIIETVPAHLTDDIWRCFLAGYNQVRPLTRLELDCLPVFSNAWTLWDIGETLVLATQWGGHRPDLIEGDLTQDEYLDEAVETLKKCCNGCMGDEAGRNAR